MRKLFFTVTALFFGIYVMAQPSVSAFRHITVEEGLSSNQVRSLMQDRFGFIWIGTDEGLDRYDGRNVRKFAFPEKWSGLTVLSMLEDDCVIWVGTDAGLFRFMYDPQVIERVDVVTSDGVALEQDISSICKDKDGNLWISTMGQGVFRYNPETARTDNFEFPLCSNDIASVYVDRSNQIWAVTNWGRAVLSVLNKTKDMFEEFNMICDGSKIYKGGLVLLEDSRHRFWMASWTDGLYEIDRITGHVVRHLIPDNVRYGITHIHSLIEYGQDQLAVGSDDGILLYDLSNGKTELFTEGLAPSTGLSNRFVYPLLKDVEGGLWAGTYYGGVNYRSPFTDQFKGYTHNPFRPNSIGGKVISCFCEDGDRNIWVASDDGGLSRFNPRTEQFANYTSSNSGLSYDNIHALCVDGDDLWIGTYTGGTNVLDMRTGKFRVYMPEEGNEKSISGTSSYAIMKDSDGEIWVATMEGINKYDRKGDCFIRVKRTDSHVIDIDQDESGNIWFSTSENGLLRLDVRTGEWREYSRSDDEFSLPSNRVNCAFLDSQDVMWFGTDSGLCRYDAENDRFDRVILNSSLSNVHGIIEDQQMYWLLTDHGLVRLNRSGELQVFSMNDGLRSSQFISNAIYKASDGCIYIGTTNGFNAFHPYQIRTNHVAPHVLTVGLTVDNEQVLPGNPMLGEETKADARRIELDHRNNSLKIQYASMSFCIPDKNQFAYMLEGFDEEWQYVGNNTTATYTNLPEGTYSFKVYGTNNDAVWSESAAELEIVVHPHPLLSAAFKIIYFILGFLMILLVVLIAVRMKSREYEKQMKDMEDRKEREIYEAKIKFFTMIAHEIRTPVSLIIGPLENIIKKTANLPARIKDDLQTMDRNSQRLLYLVNQLLDFRKVEQDAMTMRFVRQPIIPLLHSVCERFEPTFRQNGTEFIVEYPSVELEASVDSEALTKLISNLLTNASKYTDNLVRLSCDISPENKNEFYITVYDNGCGISPEEQAKIFLPFYQTMENKPGTGIGLSLVKSIAELHGGSISVSSEPGSYSSFIVRLPIFHEGTSTHEENRGVQPAYTSENLSLDDILNTDVIEIVPESKPVVMIVDDNEDIVRFLTDTLSGSYSVLPAYNGREALEKLESHPETALVIADWMMPEMDGVELCRKVRANVSISHIPFILLTAKTDDSSKIIGMDCGADAYIEKPFSIQYLEACIRNQVAMRERLRQRYSSLPLTPITDVANTSLDNRFLQTMTNLIEENFSDSNLSIDFLTEQMGISRSSFYNKIKSLTDKTPNELIQLMRLKKAAQLILENKCRINEVCYMVGFNNPSYFSKCFYKQFGVRPGEFASSMDRNEHPSD